MRQIKPGFFRNEELFDLELETGLPIRVAYAGLWTVCDRAGRFEWKPRTLKCDVLPFDDVDFSRVLDALATRGFLVRYEVDGITLGYVPSWHKHQSPNVKEWESDLPAPPEGLSSQALDACATRDLRVKDACVTKSISKSKEKDKSIVEDCILDGAPGAAQGEELPKPPELSPDVPASPEKPVESPKPAKVTAPTALAERIYQAYPRHVAPGDARQAIPKAIARIAKVDGISQADAAESLLSRVETYAARVKREGTETRFVPYPATWFNGERYDDDSLQGESPGAVKYTDPTAVYESPEYQRAGARRSA